jgi:hypothetical protein
MGHSGSKCRAQNATPTVGVDAARHAPGRSQRSGQSRAGRSQSRRRRRQNRTNRIDVSDTAAATDSVINSLVINSVEVRTIQLSEPGSFKLVVTHLAGVPINFVLDLGAKVSIVNRTQYETALNHVTILETSNSDVEDL